MFSNNQVAISELPKAEHVSFEPMADNAPIESLISWGITFALLATILVTLYILLSPDLSVVLIASGMYSMFLGWIIFYIFASHKKRGIAVRSKDILYVHGLIWRSTTAIPFNRIQHIETVRGPIERYLGLASIRIFSAGGLSSDLSISGLELQRASSLKKLILDKTESEIESEANVDESTSE
ncbi:PH domain-containing protein [Psychrosphaera ytuae]|uniref:PH domain-containing protein n=1 Tax=Psychrosphaera ytuae TaxID=2820710 RepID=A0A975DC63_9GAMM|nr:PH domain-containing protein [Psychrosphaera ytuae]QTH62950.1 PH domain-containing protein [Psychrosphaera ytuae]